VSAVWLAHLTRLVYTGTASAIWLDDAHGGLRDITAAGWRVDLLGGATPDVVYPLIALSFALGLGSLLGLGGRLMVFAHLQVFSALVAINTLTGGSYDELMANTLWLVVLAPSTATLSLDCKRTTGAWTSDLPHPGWARGLMVFQLVLMYTSTGWQKLSAHWVPGGDLLALYYILQQPSFARWDHAWVAWVAPLTQLATLVSWLWEVFGPLWLVAWLKRAGAERAGRPHPAGWSRIFWLWTALGVTFHLGIEALMDVGPFGWASLALYPALFAPAAWSALGARLGSRLSAGRPSSPGSPG
jgi:hypothetical protein